MQYTVVHSKDPYLLARLATDLQMEGNDFDCDNDDLCPFDDNANFLHTWEGGINSMFGTNGFRYINVTRHELTSRNYIKVLTQILEP